MSIPAWLLAIVGFLSIGASFILQLLVALGLPYIKGIYFLYINFTDSSVSNTTLRVTFGVWSQCLSQTGAYACSPNGLGYQQTFQGVNSAISSFFVNKLPYALVLQPVSAGFTGLAAGAAFLAICTNSFLWPLAALWASFLTMAALVIELVLFILARNKARNFNATGTLTPSGAELGPAIWMQVASLPPVFFGFMMLAAAWYIKRSRSNDKYYDDYQPERAAYYNEPPEKEYYNNAAPIRPVSRASRASRRERYDDYYEPEESRTYGNVGRRTSSRRSMRPSYADDYERDDRRSFGDDRVSRRSYGGDNYGSRSSIAAPAAPYRGGRSRRYSERGAY